MSSSSESGELSASSSRSSSPSLLSSPAPLPVSSLHLSADCAGASYLTRTDHAIIRGSFLSAARERRKHNSSARLWQRSASNPLSGCDITDGGESVVAADACQDASVSQSAADTVDASRASTAPSSTASSLLLSSSHSSSNLSSPSSFRISPRSPVSPSAFVDGPIPSHLSGDSDIRSSVCVFPIRSGKQLSKQRGSSIKQRAVRNAHPVPVH